jgi:hypothetical protein
VKNKAVNMEKIIEKNEINSFISSEKALKIFEKSNCSEIYIEIKTIGFLEIRISV